MNKVWFRCNKGYDNIFILNTNVNINTIPVVGDKIKPDIDDFQKCTFRAKKKYFSQYYTSLEFVVISREYDLKTEEWELICEPTPDTLAYYLSIIKVK